MSEMVPTGSKYTDDQRRAAAIQYAIEGSLTKIAHDHCIPRTTINEWSKTEWWLESIVKVRRENETMVLAKAAQIVDAAQDQTMKELPNATALPAATIGGIWLDKGRVILNQPTSITGKATSISDLAKEFNKLANERVVAVQHTTSSGDDDVD